MTVKIDKKENNEVLLTIEIDGKTVNEHYDRACKRIAQRVNIPGFRKGKAPKMILEKNVGKEYIQREVLDTVLPPVLSNTISENKFDTVLEPSIEKYEYDKDNKLTAVIKIELRPEFELQEYKGMAVEVNKFKTPEDAIEKEIDTIKERFAEKKNITDRKTVGTDIVNIDFEGFVDGEALAGGKANSYVLDLAHSTFIPGFAEQLVDRELNSEFTIDVKFPENYHDEKIQGKDAQFKIKINAITEKVLPELNDELAKKVGNFKTVDELKEDIQKYLDYAEKTENNKRIGEVVYKKLLDETEINVQEAMINREIDAMINELKQRFALQGQNFDKIMGDEKPEKMRSEMRVEAIKRIKSALIINKIAIKENIKVLGSDIDAKIAEISRMYGTTPDAIVSEIKQNYNLLQSLSQQILAQKVTAFLVENAKVNETVNA